MAEGMGIYKAMAAIMEEVGAVDKDKRVNGSGMNYKFRGIDDIYNALHDIMGKHKVFCLPYVVKKEFRYTNKNAEIAYLLMRYRFCHADGSYVECETIGEGLDYSDKTCNKAMSMAHKYALLQIFCIPTEEMAEADKVYETVKEPRQEKNSQAQVACKGKAEARGDEVLRRGFFNFMQHKYEGNRKKIGSELSDFFGRQISCTADLSDGEIMAYLNAVNENM